MSTTHQKAEEQNLIYITWEAKLKQDRIVQLCDKEVGWVGVVKQHNALLVIEDILIPRQEVSSTSVDVLPEDFGIAELMEEHPDLVQFMRYFGHSHVNMSSYFSGTDTTQIDDWRKYGLDWCINHVQNKRGESKTRFDMFEPFHFAIDITRVITLIPKVTDEWVQEQLKEKVSVKKPTNVHTNFQRQTTTQQRGNTTSRQAGEPTAPKGMVEARKGNYTTLQDGWRREFANHTLIRAEHIKTGDVELYEDGKLTARYNKKDLPAADGRAEGNGTGRQLLLPAAVQEALDRERLPQTPTASEAQSGAHEQQSVSASGQPEKATRVRQVLASGEVLTEEEAAMLMGAQQDDTPEQDEPGESNIPELDDEEEFELQMAALGLGFHAMNHHMMN